MKQKILKNQKPIEYDIHLKYLCQQCGQSHWLSFRESATKNFKVVCSCGNIFKVKRTLSFNIKYYKPQNTEVVLPIQMLNEAISALENYGFTKLEATELIQKTYTETKISDSISLVKETLASLRNK